MERSKQTPEIHKFAMRLDALLKRKYGDERYGGMKFNLIDEVPCTPGPVSMHYEAVGGYSVRFEGENVIVGCHCKSWNTEACSFVSTGIEHLNNTLVRIKLSRLCDDIPALMTEIGANLNKRGQCDMRLFFDPKIGSMKNAFRRYETADSVFVENAGDYNALAHIQNIKGKHNNHPYDPKVWGWT